MVLPTSGICGVVTEAMAGRLHLNGRATPAPATAAYFKKSRRFDMRVLSLLFLDFYEFGFLVIQALLVLPTAESGFSRGRGSEKCVPVWSSPLDGAIQRRTKQRYDRRTGRACPLSRAQKGIATLTLQNRAAL